MKSAQFSWSTRASESDVHRYDFGSSVFLHHCASCHTQVFNRGCQHCEKRYCHECFRSHGQECAQSSATDLENQVQTCGDPRTVFTSEINSLLTEAYANGIPSVRMMIHDEMYKFDFEKMKMRNLSAVSVTDLLAPHGISPRPQNRSTTNEHLIETRKSPIREVHDACRGRTARPLYAVRVPEGAIGKTINVPHPKKLGKSMPVIVPIDAQVGRFFFVPVPRSRLHLHKSAKVAAGGVTVALGELVAAGGTAALVTAGAGPLVCGLPMAGLVAVGAVGLKRALKEKVAATGAVSIGALPLSDHVGDEAEGAGDGGDLRW